jgi:hypothetical protein
MIPSIHIADVRLVRAVRFLARPPFFSTCSLWESGEAAASYAYAMSTSSRAPSRFSDPRGASPEGDRDPGRE